MEFLQSQGNTFISGGSLIQLRGVGLGNWLTLEHFMFGLPGTDAQIRQAVADTYGAENAITFWDRYYSVYVDEDDIRYLHECGMNHVRIPVNFKLFFTDCFERSVAIREIDRILPYLKKYKIWGIIDLHAVPGGQNPDWHSDNSSGKDNFWSDADAMSQVVELWGRIADYYKNEPAIGGYDLINEPCYFSADSETNMITFFERCTAEIREVDGEHIIFYAGNTYSRDFSMFSGNFDANSSYTFHLYPFLQIPDDLHAPDIDRKLKESLARDVSYKHLTEQLQKPLWCGETGHPLHLPESYHALIRFIAMLETEKIGWALWPLKDCGAMAMVHAEKKGLWNQLCAKLSDNWVFWDIFTKDSILSSEKETDRYKYYEWLAGESTVGWKVVCEHLKTVPFETLLNALDDFKFENCIKNNKLVPSTEWLV